MHVLARAPVAGAEDLVIAQDAHSVGLYLQAHGNAARFYNLTVEPKGDCKLSVVRMAATDAVVACQSDGYYSRPEYHKFVFDPRAKALVAEFRYKPFRTRKVFPSGTGAVFAMDDNEKQLAVEYRPGSELPFRVMGRLGGEALDCASPHRRGSARAPRWVREDGRIWYGKSFYDGEGSTGVGGFGYFDLQSRQLHPFDPREIADWSVSAMSVGPDDVWMSLVNNGEGSSLSGGLLRFDRQSEQVEPVAYPDVGLAMLRLGDQVLIGSDYGIAVVTGKSVRRFFVDRMSNGRFRVAEATEK
jgi:hypothetical protein